MERKVKKRIKKQKGLQEKSNTVDTGTSVAEVKVDRVEEESLEVTRGPDDLHYIKYVDNIEDYE